MMLGFFLTVTFYRSVFQNCEQKLSSLSWLTSFYTLTQGYNGKKNHVEERQRDKSWSTHVMHFFLILPHPVMRDGTRRVTEHEPRGQGAVGTVLLPRAAGLSHFQKDPGPHHHYQGLEGHYTSQVTDHVGNPCSTTILGTSLWENQKLPVSLGSTVIILQIHRWLIPQNLHRDSSSLTGRGSPWYGNHIQASKLISKKRA